MSCRGVALIASLMLLAALVTLALAAMVLARVNLAVARNVRDEVRARAQAEAGIEVGFLVLDEYLTRTGRLPETAPSLPRPGGMEYRLVAYERETSSEAWYVVEGAAAGARFRSEARVEVLDHAQDPLFSRGFVAGGDIRVTSAEVLDLDVWSGGDLEVGGDPPRVVGELRAAGARCLLAGKACRSRVAAPRIPLPDFATEAAGIRERSGACDVVVAGAEDLPRLPAGVICLVPGAVVTLTEPLEGVTILGDATTSVRVVAPIGDGVTIVSGTVDLESGGPNHGTMTILAAGDITLTNGFSSANSGGQTHLISAGGDVLFQGSGSFEGMIWAGGSVGLGGITSFRGAAVAGATLTTPAAVLQAVVESLPDELVPRDPLPELRMISRR